MLSLFALIAVLIIGEIVRKSNYDDVTLPELFSNGYKQKAISYYTYLMSKIYGKFLIPVNYILKKILQKGRFKRLKLTLGGSNL